MATPNTTGRVAVGVMPDSFPWLALNSDEEVLWSGQPRRHVLLWIALPALFVPLVSTIVLPMQLGPVVGALVWGGLTALAYLYVTNIHYVVTTGSIYSKRGILGRVVTQVGLHNIQDTTLRQGIVGTYTDYGTVSFSTAGGEGTTLGFYLIDEPASVKSTVDGRVSAQERQQEPTADDSPASGAEELLSELRTTRQTAERIEKTLEGRAHR